MSDDRIARGKKIRDGAFGKEGLKTWDELNAICPTHARAIHEYCFGTIWDRPHLDLKPREYLLLEYFARNEGRVVTRTMLLEQVWDYHFDPGTNVIDVHISRLRKKIDEGAEIPLLHTVRGAGYMLSENA